MAKFKDGNPTHSATTGALSGSHHNKANVRECRTRQRSWRTRQAQLHYRTGSAERYKFQSNTPLKLLVPRCSLDLGWTDWGRQRGSSLSMLCHLPELPFCSAPSRGCSSRVVHFCPSVRTSLRPTVRRQQQDGRSPPTSLLAAQLIETTTRPTSEQSSNCPAHSTCHRLMFGLRQDLYSKQRAWMGFRRCASSVDQLLSTGGISVLFCTFIQLPELHHVPRSFLDWCCHPNLTAE